MKRAWNFKDLTGQRFGRLTVIEYSHTHGKRAYWKCRCDCGNYSVAMGKNLLSGKTKSCGCLMRERAAEHMGKVGRKYGSITGKENLRKALAEGKGTTNGNYKHGHSNTRLYRIWAGIKQRCYNENDTNYHWYGGRGITVCEEWRNNFEAFYKWSMANGYTDKKSIDRINSNGDYCPENCRWTDITTQANNTRRNHYIKHNGKIKTIAEWAKDTGISQQAISSRLRNRWSIEKTLETPVKKINAKKKP